MVQIRPHLSDYAQSMALVVHVQCADDVLAYIRCFYPEKRAQPHEVAQRFFGPDHRNGWQSWLVTVRSSPVLWADGPVPDLPHLQPISC